MDTSLLSPKELRPNLKQKSGFRIIQVFCLPMVRMLLLSMQIMLDMSTCSVLIVQRVFIQTAVLVVVASGLNLVMERGSPPDVFQKKAIHSLLNIRFFLGILMGHLLVGRE